MKVCLLEEPILQFGNGTHIDIRAGIATHGTFDRGEANVPVPIGVGLVGTTATVDGVRDWLEKCREGVHSSETRLKELRPDFPGMQPPVFGTRLEVSDATTRTVSRHELQTALADANPMARVVELFIEHARDLSGRGGLHVMVIAPPIEVFSLGDAVHHLADDELDEGQDVASPYVPGFHDIFKAQALELAVPCQMLRPDTYGGPTNSSKHRKKRTLQDIATRAWNFHTALYYSNRSPPSRRNLIEIATLLPEALGHLRAGSLLGWGSGPSHAPCGLQRGT